MFVSQKAARVNVRLWVWKTWNLMAFWKNKRSKNIMFHKYGDILKIQLSFQSQKYCFSKTSLGYPSARSRLTRVPGELVFVLFGSWTTKQVVVCLVEWPGKYQFYKKILFLYFFSQLFYWGPTYSWSWLKVGKLLWKKYFCRFLQTTLTLNEELPVVRKF